MRLHLTFRPTRARAFSLLEMLVAMATLLAMLVMIFRITQGTADAWKNSSGKMENFREARAAFETITRVASQATLNAYFDYVDASGNYITKANAASLDHYARRSDLHFITGKSLLSNSSVHNPTSHAIFFQAPLSYVNSSAYRGGDSFLNACGFYLYYGPDINQPGFLTGAGLLGKNRFRLMQFTQPAENLSLYDVSVTGNSASWNNKNWFITPIGKALSGSTPSSVFQIANNIVAFVILPKYSNTDAASIGTPLSSDYEYDSRDKANAGTYHQLPPVVQITIVAIDQASSLKLGNTSQPPSLGLDSLFRDSTRLTADLTTLGNNLAALNGNAAGNRIPLRYEIFQSEVALRAAKWSK